MCGPFENAALIRFVSSIRAWPPSTISFGSRLPCTQLSGCTFESNEADSAGGALYLTSSAVVSCEDCVFEDNVAEQGGAIQIVASSEYTDVGGTYTDNEATDDEGGAIRLSDGGILSMSSASLSGNVARRSGGAVYLEEPDDTVTFSGCSLMSNQTETGDGGAIAAAGDAEVSLSDTELSDNEAAGDGGAIAVEGGELTLEDCTVSDNLADDGGGILAEGAELLQLTDTELVGNEATGDGGAVLAEECAEVSLTRLLLHDNEAGDAGGALLERDSPADGVTGITNSRFTENISTDGAAVYRADCAAQAEIVNNTFAANDASDDGAHLYLSAATVSFINNIAWQAADGGGLYAVDSDSA